MEPNQDFEVILNQIEAPAFFVQSDSVHTVNAAAAKYGISTGQSIYDLIDIGKEEYSVLLSGSLYLTAVIHGTSYECSVTRLEKGNLFVLEDTQTDLQLLSLTARQLSFPLSELSVILDGVKEIESSKKEKINQILYQLHRITNNMSDAVRLQRCSVSFQTIELCAFLEELLHKVIALFSGTAIKISYTIPKTAMYAPAAAELLERAIYNLISNAVKFGNAQIHVTLSQMQSKAYISVSNGLQTNHLPRNMFARYKRSPGMEDPYYGLGLGMTLVHTIARAHGGTVLVETPAENEINVTLSLTMKPPKNSIIRSPIIKPDIYGGRDRALIELSNVLPSQLYNTDIF